MCTYTSTHEDGWLVSLQTAEDSIEKYPITTDCSGGFELHGGWKMELVVGRWSWWLQVMVELVVVERCGWWLQVMVELVVVERCGWLLQVMVELVVVGI